MSVMFLFFISSIDFLASVNCQSFVFQASFFCFECAEAVGRRRSSRVGRRSFRTQPTIYMLQYCMDSRRSLISGFTFRA